jgi:hypothetical protein
MSIVPTRDTCGINTKLCGGYPPGYQPKGNYVHEFLGRTILLYWVELSLNPLVGLFKPLCGFRLINGAIYTPRCNCIMGW